MADSVVHLKTLDFAGRPITLSSHPANWREIGQHKGSSILLLGLGPGNPAELPFLNGSSKVYWLEDPCLHALLPEPPASWRRLERIDELPAGCRIFFYSPGLKISPSYWGPLLGQLETSQFGQKERTQQLAWLPGNSRQLLHIELEQALRNLGFNEILTGLPQQDGRLVNFFQGRVPEFALSVNFRGLDSQVFYQLKSMEVPLAIWLVDNPWHILAGQQLPWWKEACLFVTDSSYIIPMRQAGAKNVFYAPLAVSPGMWRKTGKGKEAPIFVGRTAFPEKDTFFHGTRLRPAIWEEANALLHSDAQDPDYHWWLHKTGAVPWPGRAAREAGLGADLTSCARRVHWLKTLLNTGLRIIGDEGWQKVLPSATVLPPVDYYGQLPDFYHSSAFTANVTSLLLPNSLNQRHFDVWAAGGFLLTDFTPGLALFPHELASEISARTPEELLDRADFFASRPGHKKELQAAWRDVMAFHTYENRITDIRKKVAIA